ncbi:MAG: sulfotransferase [Actinomycetota bacterium]|nr:sulfotransferase [Actinomycetota bacterium]
MGTERLATDRLVEEAIAVAGHDDFGESTWREGLDVLLPSVVEEGRLNDIGVEMVAGEVVRYLSNRLAITAWRQEHPAVAEAQVVQPIVIVGQPRTGTTILFDLLAQDPALRAPLTWEVDLPLPPPSTATYDTDERIGEVQATLDMADVLIPGFTAFHEIGARLGQECVRITGCDFRSMIFPIQYRVPSYNRWLMHEADLAPAYRWHRRFLQHLQSGHPGGQAPVQWLLKSPAHLWHLDALVGEYPDAVIVQTHRDPLKVIASISALAANLRRMASDDTSVADAAEQYADDILLGLERGLDARDRGVIAADQVVDVQFTDFVRDPMAAVRRLYSTLGRELPSSTENDMRRFLAAHPGDGGGGGTRYRWSDTGLDEAELRARAKPYVDRFDVAEEVLA